MNPRILLSAVIAVICIASVAAFAVDKNDRVAADKLPDFSGKTLLVYTSREARFPTWIVVDARLNRIGNRLFLSGQHADTRPEQDWRSGFETHIAWDVVTTYQVLTAKECEKILDDAQAGR